MLSQKQLQNVCLLFSGDYKQCRYLEEDYRTWQWTCLKKQGCKCAKDQIIDKFLEECKICGTDPKTKGVALGDNCAGYPTLRNITQGYDCP